MQNTPDKWIVVKIQDLYKVFGTWYGGYLGNSAWKLNSGITEVKENGDFYYFHGYSGSIYKCHKKAYGTNFYTQSMLDVMIERSKEEGIEFTVMPEDTDFSNLINKP